MTTRRRVARERRRASYSCVIRSNTYKNSCERIDPDSVDEQKGAEVMNRKERIEKGDNRDDMLDSKQI